MRFCKPRTLGAVKNVIDNESIKKLNVVELKAFEIFRLSKQVNKSDFVLYTGMPYKTAQRLLKRFVELGLIQSVGAGRSTMNVLSE